MLFRSNFCFFFFKLLVSCINCLCILEKKMCILDINTLSIVSFANIFSRKLFFPSVDGFLCCPKAFKFDWVPFFNFCFYFFCLGRLT